VAAAVAVFFLRRIPVESLVVEEVLGSEYLPAAEWTQGAPILPRQPAAVGAEALLQGPHVFEKLQPL